MSFFLNSLKLKIILTFKSSVLTSKKTQPMYITRINWLMLFREIIAVFSENHMIPINTLCGQTAELLIVKAGGIVHHWALEG
jgi:hypothetical protein